MPGWTSHSRVDGLIVDSLAGNVAVVTVSDLEPDTAVVAHTSEEVFAPQVHVDDAKRLRIESWPSPLSFVQQSMRINTLVLVPPGLTEIDASLKAGELWVFGDAQNVAADCVRASLFAGDVVLVDVIASRIGASNYLGDVTVHWDCDRSSSRSIKIAATTKLGDANVTTSGTIESENKSGVAHSVLDWRGKWFLGTGRGFFNDEISPKTKRN